MSTWKKYLTTGGAIWWIIVGMGAIAIVLLVAKRLYG